MGKKPNQVFIVDNNDGVILSIMTDENKAKDLKVIGKKRWNETWKVTPITLNHIESWVLEGDELYREVSRR